VINRDVEEPRWKRVETAGVRDRKPHAMRHTFATEVLDATEDDLYA
jgi:integrase